MLHWKKTCFAVRSADRLLSQMQIQKIQKNAERVCSRETWWSHGGQVFAAKDIHEKGISCERRRAWDGWYRVLSHRAPPLHTHAHPCLFVEGISCWNVTIAMQSVPQLPDVPIGVQGKTFLHTSLSRQGSEIANRRKYYGCVGEHSVQSAQV